MRIRSKQSPTESIKSTRESGAFIIKNKQVFSEIFAHEQLRDGKNELQSMLNLLDELGERLVKRCTLHELKLYKNTLKEFFQSLQTSTYELKEESGHSRRGKTKIYQRIELIDRELEKLSHLVLDEQKDKIKILAKLNQIRGLLLDLYS